MNLYRDSMTASRPRKLEIGCCTASSLKNPKNNGKEIRAIVFRRNWQRTTRLQSRNKSHKETIYVRSPIAGLCVPAGKL